MNTLRRLPRGPGAGHGPRHGQSGIAILEATVAMAILAIAMLAMTTTSVTVFRMKESDRVRREATVGLQSLVEDIRGVSDAAVNAPNGWAREVVTTYAPGGRLGDSFGFGGLEPWPGEDDVYSVTIITDETQTDQELGVELGMPRDLDNDLAVTRTNVTNTARMLPVIVRARWVGRTGNRELQTAFYLLGY